MSNILILAEHSNGKPKKYSLELAGKAAELAAKAGGSVVALIAGEGARQAAEELGKCGAKKVLVAEGDAFKRPTGDVSAKALCDAVAAEKPEMVLGTASTFGKDVMARAAARLNAGLASDCVAIDVDGGRLKARRPIYAGKALIDVKIDGDVQMATLRPNIFPAPAATGSAPEITALTTTATTGGAKVADVVESESGMVDLTEADRIVAAGRGIGSAENFNIIKELARSIGASVGASRAAVDAGYISHDHQVGQTGKTVNPTLYIACGISGAIQHMAGMRTSKVIVAINKDAEAPIFTKADYGIVGDMFEVVPAMTGAFKKLLSE